MSEQTKGKLGHARSEDAVMAHLAKLEADTANFVEFTGRTVAEPAAGELITEILRGVTLAGIAVQIAHDVWKGKGRPNFGAAEEKR